MSHMHLAVSQPSLDNISAALRMVLGMGLILVPFFFATNIIEYQSVHEQ